jgi:hypothetical protein
MPRPPLFPLLRLGTVIIFGLCLFFTPGRPAPPTHLYAPPIHAPVWATDMLDTGRPWRIGEHATGPLEGQKRPPCTPRREKEYKGGCWIPHAEKPPCPEGVFEGDGVCLVPVKAAQRPPSALEP